MPAKNPVIFNTVADRNRVFNTLDQKWSKVDRLLQGTDAMRAAGELMLPKGENEEQSVYNERLNETTLLPLYKQAVTMTTSMIVSEDIEVTNVSGDFLDFFDDVDGAGTDLTQFSEQLLKTAIHYGVGYALVDFPREGEDGRPFYSIINPRNVLGFNTKRVNGREQLVDFRFFETISKEDDNQALGNHGESISDINQVEQGMFADQIRQYKMDPETGEVSFVIWTRTKKNLTWVKDDEGIMSGIDRIPIVAAYGNKDSYFIGTPVYEDAAELNIKLWRTTSIQDYALKFNRYPAYIVTGIGEEQTNSPANPNDVPSDEKDSGQNNLIKIPYGPGAIIGTPNPNVQIQKFDGQSESLNLGFTDIDRTIRSLKEAAPILTLTDVQEDVTATATNINATQAVKTVRKIARNYKNSLLQMAAFVQPWFNTQEFPNFEVHNVLSVQQEESTEE